VRISKIKIKNFRLLHDVELQLEQLTTVVVGRNNCGKTSLSDVIKRFLDDRGSFEIEDFSSASYDGFCAALKALIKNAETDEVRKLVPYVELRIHIVYDSAIPTFGPLKDFIIDTDDSCTEAVLVCRRELEAGAIKALFDGHESVSLEGDKQNLAPEARLALFRSLGERVPKLFTTRMWAEDPNDPNNTREVSLKAVRGVLSLGFVNAQRGLDGTGSREADILAKVLEGLFMSASLPGADGSQRDIAEGLRKAVDEIQTAIDVNFKSQLKKLMPTIEDFGYPGLDGPSIQAETTLEVTKLLSNFTKIQYAGYNGVQLPESYNGLGFRNLLFILLRIVGFYRAFRAEAHEPAVHLIVIEEPEAHLHPQMQEVFIRHLSAIAKKLCEQDIGADGGKVEWPVQFVVSTHSPHVANEARFEAIRYFAVTSKDRPVGVRCTEVKDLRSGLAGEDKAKIEFLHQYLTLTRCDLFFADKAVLIEGTSERLILPQIVRLLDQEDEKLKLGSQYITIMEVGGAYAHIFIPLLDFLELRSLIITDIDSVRKNEKNRWIACLVHDGASTSNSCIKRWFKGADESSSEDDEDSDNQSNNVLTINELLDAEDQTKIRNKIRLAYQVPESDGGPCGRTFEDSFVLANQGLFGVSGNTNAELETAAREYVEGEKKSKFALTYAIDNTSWVPPHYIADGMRWLAKGDISDIDPGLTLVAQASAAATVESPAASKPSEALE
jgi:putative ATP-dependent endonuclease of the OLD family